MGKLSVDVNFMATTLNFDSKFVKKFAITFARGF